MPLISIIIPVYNVEKYLQECVDSVINQTYTNLEIILVDDASPDSCPEICDEYAKTDSRIKVIHQEKNCGVSAARNRGLDACSGKYIYFSDSDDILDSDVIEFLYDKLIENNADISTCSFFYYYKNSCEIHNPNQLQMLLTNEEAYNEVIEMKNLFPAPWGKLYKSEIFEDIRYPEHMIYEDTYIIGEVFLKAPRIFMTTLPKVKYRQLKGSIMHTEFKPKMMQLVPAFGHCIDLAKQYYPKAIKVCMWRYLWSFFVILDNMITYSATNTDEFKTIIKNIRKNYFNIIKEPNFSLKKKLSLFLLVLTPKLYVKLYIKESSKNIDTHQYFD